VAAFFIVAPLGALQIVSIASPAGQPGSLAIAAPPVTESRLLEYQPIQSPPPTLENRAQQKWLEEDVAYIISDQETQAFRTLPTNDERERFIEQFWLRRDPTPNSVENEFQEQHYLRIAYANMRFESNQPGWQTDRGRMFILHGRANQVEYHGSGTDRPYPFEVWTYRYLDGIGSDVRFEFIDPEMNGEFRLNVEPELRRKLFFQGSAAYPVPPPQAVDVPPSDGDGVTVQATLNPWWRPPVYYPGDAVREGIEGPVMAELTVNAAGEVVDARILSGPEELRKVILQAVLRWQYAADSNPTRIIQVTVFFRLPQSHTLVTSSVSLQDEIYNIGGDVAPPAVTHKVDPVYTVEAREQRHQGTVVVEAVVRTNGTIEIVRVAKSLGFGLDEQAIVALKQWRFEPATRNGLPVNVRVKIEVNFNLR
jgi:TonB family protein